MSGPVSARADASSCRFRQTCIVRCGRAARGLVSLSWKLVCQILKGVAQSTAHCMNRGTSYNHHQVNSCAGVELAGANRAAAGEFPHQRLGHSG